MRNVAIAGLVMAAADYAMQRRRIGKQTRMTKHEVKQEHKQSEGDPLLKGAIRSRQLAAARNRMMADVAERRRRAGQPDPRRRRAALRRRAAARRGWSPGVPAWSPAGSASRPPRSRRAPGRATSRWPGRCYGSTQVGQEIPAELFAAVAQVLAFVISRRTQGARGGEHRSPARGTADAARYGPGVARRRRSLGDSSQPRGAPQEPTAQAGR